MFAMSGDESPNPQSQAPTSWRDVYALVQDAEKRLTSQINDGFQRQSSVSADHEVRLRVLEATDLKQSGGVAALGAGRTLLLTLMSAASIIIAIAGFLSKG